MKRKLVCLFTGAGGVLCSSGEKQYRTKYAPYKLDEHGQLPGQLSVALQGSVTGTTVSNSGNVRS